MSTSKVYTRGQLVDCHSKIPELPDGSCVVLRSTVGSTVHGTSVNAQDDLDEMALVIEPPSHVIGLSHWETTVLRTQPEGARSGPGDVDLVAHSLRKFVRLAVRGNPTILLMLFANPSFVTQIGAELLKAKNVFLSRAAGQPFLGYMRSQMMRMTGESGGRHGQMRPELVEQYGFDTKYAGHIIRLGYQGIELLRYGTISLPMLESARQHVIDVRTGKYTLEQVMSQGRDLEETLKKTIERSPLQETYDAKLVDQLLRRWYQRAWSDQGFVQVPSIWR